MRRKTAQPLVEEIGLENYSRADIVRFDDGELEIKLVYQVFIDDLEVILEYGFVLVFE